MKNIKEEIIELKNIQADFLQMITDMEIYVPMSSDELYEQVKLLTQYHKTIANIDEKLSELYISLGSEKLFSELLEASHKGKAELVQVATQQMSAMNFPLRNISNDNK